MYDARSVGMGQFHFSGTASVFLHFPNPRAEACEIPMQRFPVVNEGDFLLAAKFTQCFQQTT